MCAQPDKCCACVCTARLVLSLCAQPGSMLTWRIQQAPSQLPTTAGSASVSPTMNWFICCLLSLLKYWLTHRSVAPLLPTRGTTTHPGVAEQAAAVEA